MLLFALALLVAIANSGCAKQGDDPFDVGDEADQRVFKSATLVYEVSPEVEDSAIDLKALAEALYNRLNPELFSFHRIAVTPEGTRQVKIEVGKCTAGRLEWIKLMVSSVGSLEFRILANTKDHGDLIHQAQDIMENDLRIDGEIVARWVAIDWRIVKFASEHEKFDQEIIEQARATDETEVEINRRTAAYWLTLDPDTIPDEFRNGIITRELESETQVLVLTNSSVDFGGYVLRVNDVGILQTLVIQDEFNVTGAHLSSAGEMIDETGRLAIAFAFDNQGTQKFAMLTSEYSPDRNGFRRQLGVLLDDTLITAPTLNEPITGGHGVISGNFTMPEVKLTVAVLQAGSLPVPLVKEPVSENVVE